MLRFYLCSAIEWIKIFKKKEMQIILSPAKQIKIDLNEKVSSRIPPFIKEAERIHQVLKTYSERELGTLYKMSSKLAQDTYQGILDWNSDFLNKSMGQALLSYRGAVFQKLGAENFSESELSFADQHLNILSAFYGVLAPLDLIKPYRLDMKVKLKLDGGNLYKYWQKPVTQFLRQRLETDRESPFLINLASDEFFKMIDLKSLNFSVLSITFKEKKGELYKVVGMSSKQARGWMVRFILKNKITEPEEIKTFSEQGYQFNKALSSDKDWVFSR